MNNEDNESNTLVDAQLTESGNSELQETTDLNSGTFDANSNDENIIGETATDFSHSKFSIDRSKTGKAKCKRCRKVLSKEMHRIGKLVPFKIGHIKQFFHIECIFESFLKARDKANIIFDIQSIDGVDSVPEDIKSQLTTLIEDTCNKMKDPLPKPKAKIKNSVIPLQNSKSRVSSLKSLDLTSLKILFSNADQLTSSKMTELKKQIEVEKPHIVAICEVKRKNVDLSCEMDYHIPNYTLHPVNLDNKIGRGIAVYTIASLNKSINQIDCNLGFEEVCLIEVRLRRGDVLLFGCVYRSPTPSEESSLNNNRLNRLLNCIGNKKYSHKCIVGDFNYGGINWGTLSSINSENSDETKFIEAVRDTFFHQHIEKPTRSRGNENPSLLDLILTDELLQVNDITHHAPLGKSDHSVITFDFNCYIDYSKPKEMFLYHKGDFESMRNNLLNSNWTYDFIKCDEQTTVNGKWTSLKSILIKLRDAYVPKQKEDSNPNGRIQAAYR